MCSPRSFDMGSSVRNHNELYHGCFWREFHKAISCYSVKVKLARENSIVALFHIKVRSQVFNTV